MRRSIGSRSIFQRSTGAALSLRSSVVLRLAETQLGRIARKEQFERPVEGDAQFPIESRQAQQIVRCAKKTTQRSR